MYTDCVASSSRLPIQDIWDPPLSGWSFPLSDCRYESFALDTQTRRPSAASQQSTAKSPAQPVPPAATATRYPTFIPPRNAAISRMHNPPLIVSPVCWTGKNEYLALLASHHGVSWRPFYEHKPWFTVVCPPKPSTPPRQLNLRKRRVVPGALKEPSRSPGPEDMDVDELPPPSPELMEEAPAPKKRVQRSRAARTKPKPPTPSPPSSLPNSPEPSVLTLSPEQDLGLLSADVDPATTGDCNTKPAVASDVSRSASVASGETAVDAASPSKKRKSSENDDENLEDLKGDSLDLAGADEEGEDDDSASVAHGRAKRTRKVPANGSPDDAASEKMNSGRAPGTSARPSRKKARKA
ncbi:hypothetical protein DFP72DRAFT_883733 [Ephemerocybe angulata]|uniref:Uncharacterized protein n=1 Tax=Ephemerocybe angulata TaxID=980116 RepID=A0A8H6I9C3_9AGAR|nr:hypothetical protein DFP72DRAFT_883733 [Tulosesus angulatus]